MNTDRSVGNNNTFRQEMEGDPQTVGENATRCEVRSKQSARFQTGAVLLGRYKILSELGQGGMGVVYRCFDEVAGIEVALKALPPEVAHNSGEMEEVRENFRLVSKLHHPNIANANTLEMDTVTGDYYLVMECVDGLDLRQWARQRRTQGRALTLDEVTILAFRIASALDYAHEQKVIHRDIKPSNVKVNFEGEVKVLDFGLAAQLHSSLSRVSIANHGTSGTGPYMAPEQWKGLRQGPATDQYALAATVYELLSGSPPFENHDIAILREAVLKQEPLPLKEMPSYVNAALLRALAKDVDARFVNCCEFVAALGGGNSSQARKFGSANLPGKKTWLCLAVVAVVAVLSFAYYRSCQSRQAKLLAERTASQQAAKLDAQQREKIVALKAEVESALAVGDLEKAEKKIGELRGAGDASRADELMKICQSKAGERACNMRYDAASRAREKVLKLDRGQGVGKKLDELDAAWGDAKIARQRGNWSQAVTGYDTVLASCQTLAELDGSRRNAEAQRGEAVKAKTEAEQAKSAADAADLYAAGELGCTRAAAAFEKGNFDVASKAWQEAAQNYALSMKRALAVQEYRIAKTAFESELGAPSSERAVLLKKHGGSTWTGVMDSLRIAESATHDPSDGAKRYRDALAVLTNAVAEARAKMK